jgi:hypothetical protein
MTAAVLRFFAAGGQSFVGIRLGGDVVGVVACIGDQGLDIFHIGAVDDIGHFGDFLFVIDVHFYDPFFMAEIFFDTGLAFFALNGGGLDEDGHLSAFLLGEGDAENADEGKQESEYLFHNITGFKKVEDTKSPANRASGSGATFLSSRRGLRAIWPGRSLPAG